MGRGAEKISCPVPRLSAAIWLFCVIALIASFLNIHTYTHLNANPNQVKMVKEMMWKMTFMSSHSSHKTSIKIFYDNQTILVTMNLTNDTAPLSDTPR